MAKNLKTNFDAPKKNQHNQTVAGDSSAEFDIVAHQSKLYLDTWDKIGKFKLQWSEVILPKL